MISVRNRLPPLSGNKRLLIGLTALLMAGCGPKLHPVEVPVKKPDTVATKPVVTKPTTPEAPYRPVISLILPFNLDKINLMPGAGKEGIAEADLAADYYEGFKLALDSLAASGQNFKLETFDSKDEQAQAYNLALNTKVRTSNIIVGPVYPAGLKSFSTAASSLRKLTISPLSPSPASDYKNPFLVTMIPPLQYHCERVAGYINDKLHPQKVFVLRSGFSDELKYVTPFKQAIDSLGKKRIKVIMLTVTRGNISSLVPQLSKTGTNVFVIPATDQHFLQVTLHSLDTLTKHYPVTVFGHPNWEKAKFLRAEQLQHLQTMITSTDKINYRSEDVARFVKAYRKKYHAEPGEYAFKGFDEGMYTGKLVAAKANSPLELQNYKGLHNTFHFENITGLGWVNTNVNLYKYANFELKQVE